MTVKRDLVLDAMLTRGLLASDDDAQAILDALDRYDAYHDVRWSVRPCDHCGKPYQGPAVYCSLECALADA